MSIESETIIKEIQSWLDWQEQVCLEEGIIVNDDTHIYSVPVWPSRKVLKSWINYLERLDK